MQSFINTFAAHDIVLTPAGVWKFDADNKKEAVDAKRVDHLSWDRFKNDNMARHFIDNQDLTNGLLVLDIDGADTTIKGNQLTIHELAITIPLGLYTTTTREDKYHVYYRGDVSDIANRIKGLHDTTIDIFTHGTVFEGHTFAPSNQLHEGPILPIPAELAESIYEHQLAKNLSTSKDLNALGLTSNIQRFNLVKRYLNLEESLDTEKQRNSFYKSVIPQEFQQTKLAKQRKKHIGLYPLSYDLFNKLAVKLTTTSELDYNEHVLPTLHMLLEEWGIDYTSRKSQQMLNQILPSLPQHESVFQYNRDQDINTFQQHLDAQKGTDAPVFYTLRGGKIWYIEVDKFTQIPIQHGDSHLLEEKAASRLHQERAIYSEDGRQIGWDSNVPMVYLVSNPYKPQYELDYKTERHTLNLYQPTEYVEQAQARGDIDPNNLIYKTILSTIGPDYLELYLAYSAQILYGNSSPTMVLWVAALQTEKGGSGKSVVTLELFSLLLGSAAAAVDFKTVSSGWGDIVTATKILSLEDMPRLTKEWEGVYSNIKQQNTNSYRKLNMKGAAITSERVSVAITGSTNHRLNLSPSDRRFLCLEPAHFHGQTEPLSSDEQIELSMLLGSHEYNQQVQDYADYLLGIHNDGFSDEIQRALFIEAPETPFRDKWIGNGSSNTQNLLLSLSRPADLINLIKIDEIAKDEIANLLEIMSLPYDKTTGKTAVSWKWFEFMLPFVQSDKYGEQLYSKASIAKMLHIDFKNVGKYSAAWKAGDISASWPVDGYTFTLNANSYQELLNIIGELRNA